MANRFAFIRAVVAILLVVCAFAAPGSERREIKNPKFCEQGAKLTRSRTFRTVDGGKLRDRRVLPSRQCEDNIFFVTLEVHFRIVGICRASVGPTSLKLDLSMKFVQGRAWPKHRSVSKSLSRGLLVELSTRHSDQRRMIAPRRQGKGSAKHFLAERGLSESDLKAVLSKSTHQGQLARAIEPKRRKL
ncbi:hypothetical protein EDB87DRAFT_1581535 [Lactarius vividus]|nr:hypothetical protein EDB87DRAFT_1581535 [Lactarius vividus]